jgi:hypothetical protein
MTATNLWTTALAAAARGRPWRNWVPERAEPLRLSRDVVDPVADVVHAVPDAFHDGDLFY